MKRPLKRTTSGYKKIFFEDGVCIYCGVPWEVEDHALPYSAKDAFDPFTRYLVPACKECNVVLGSSIQHLLSTRITVAKERLRSRYLKLLQMPEWSQRELEEMSPEFQASILQNLELKNIILNRLAFDYFLWTELGRPKELLL